MVKALFKRYAGRGALVLGIGGGGDVASAALLYRAISSYGIRAALGGVVWEWLTVDPVPGPVGVWELVGGKPAGPSLAWLDGETRARRDGRLIRPQLSLLCGFLGVRGLMVDINEGVDVVVSGLAGLCRGLNIDLVIGLDVGGDVLAVGGEPNLWSPLADQYMLAVLAGLAERGLKTLLAVHGPGADGELSQDYILKRLRSLKARGAYLGARGLTLPDVEFMERVLQVVRTEAGWMPILAFKGEWGQKPIRRGTRKAAVNLLTTLTLILDAYTVYQDARLAKAIRKAESLEEANQILNSMGIYTELNLEKDLYPLYRKGVEITGDLVLNVRRKGIEKLRKAL
ncbi:MAG TPA: DUF1152 domain-containing protein [Candidatus Bathyarchaeota archaeon]|nr:DUF1152 domain-containing protein [Candidatus Bathyarchaeota archaeon]